MHRLLPELLEMILKCLQVNEILICKLVNKQFYSAIKTLKLSSLVISDHSFRRRYFHSNKPVDYGHRVMIYTFRPFQPILSEPIFTNLKSLFIDFSRVCIEIENSESINQFKRLERLELDGLTLRNLECFTISLPFLRTLSIQNLDSYTGSNHPDCRITINSPSLANLRIAIRKGYKIGFTFARSVRFLEIFEWQDFVCDLTELEYLYCNRIKGVTNEKYSKLEKLKELHMDAQENVFVNLVKQRERLQRMHPKIFVLGVDFEHGSPIGFHWPDHNEAHLDEEWMAAFYWQNRHKIANVLPFINVIDYGLLEKHFGNAISAHFGGKFTDLYQLRVTKVNHKSQFINFLNDCRLRNLYLDAAAELDQSFYNDTLPTLCPTLECLVICSHPGPNYDFLFKFKSLVLITVSCELPAEFVKSVVQHFTELEMFAFTYQSQFTQVCICSKNKNVLYLGDDSPIEFKELDELFEYLLEV